MSDTKCHPIYSLAEEYGLPIAVHMGELHHCCTEESRNKGILRCGRKNCPLDERGHLSEPRQLALAAKEFPNVNFIACHLANPFFQEMRQAMSENLNIYTDFSGQFVSGSAEDTPQYRTKIVEEIKKFLDLPLGVLRMMFATDFPIQSYQDTFDLVDALNLKPIAKEMIMSGNALRILPQKG